jgi:hypothetical protein
MFKYVSTLIGFAVLFASPMSSGQIALHSNNPEVKRIELTLMRNGVVELFSFRSSEDGTTVNQFRFRLLFDEGSIANRQIWFDLEENAIQDLLEGLTGIAKGRQLPSELTDIDVTKSIFLSLDVFYDSGKQSQLVVRESEDVLSTKISGDEKLRTVFERLLTPQYPKTSVSRFDGLIMPSRKSGE